jgi:hypothetical protein
MEEYFNTNINNNENFQNEINNILIFLDKINKKINYTKINILEKKEDLIIFLFKKFKKIYLFQFMLNPNEDINNALNNSLMLLFNEIYNNLNYVDNDNINESNYLEIVKNKSIYNFLEELDDNKTSKILENHNNDIDYLHKIHTKDYLYLKYLYTQNANKYKIKDILLISISGFLFYKYIKINL